MGKRFKRIQYLLDVVGDKVKDTSIIKRYAAFKLGKKYAEANGGSADYKYKVNGQKRGSSFPAALQPFGYPVEVDKVIVKCSGRCGPSLGQNTGSPTGTPNVTGADPATFNLTLGKNATGQKVSGFRPAKANVFVQKTGGIKEKTSGITGLPYNPRNGESVSFPFGRGDGTNKATETQVRGSILTKLSAANQSVSFTDEKI